LLRAADDDPLDALTTKEQIAGVQSLLHDELARVVPGLLDQALR